VARFRVLVAGRRFGKTQVALTAMLCAAHAQPNRHIWYVGPSYRLAESIVWARLKKLTRPYWAKAPSEKKLSVQLHNGSILSLRGADRPDSLRGNGLDLVVLDEFATMRPEVWPEAIYPALSDRQGGAIFIGTPKGHNHFYDLFQLAKSGADPNWAAFQFTTAQGDLVKPSEITHAATHLDADTFRQEFEGQFIGSGRNQVYYTFNRETHVKPLEFDYMRPLVWTIDFNVNPMCMLIAQRIGDVVHILDEIILKGSNTEEACSAFLDRLSPQHKLVPAYQRPLNVEIYGDASGHQHRTSAATTDWAIIRHFFSYWKGQISHSIHVNKVNPAVRDRVNCVNARLRNMLGDVTLFIDPRCPELIRDLESVTWATDRTGRTTSEIDKSNPARTHSSDALGYYIAQAFPMLPKIGPQSSGPLM
jgi:hypothetical protein